MGDRRVRGGQGVGRELGKVRLVSPLDKEPHMNGHHFAGLYCLEQTHVFSSWEDKVSDPWQTESKQGALPGEQELAWKLWAPRQLPKGQS